MNILDIILAVPLLWFAYRGFQKGLVIELASLVALILGIWAAIHFSFFAADFLTDNFDIGPKYLPVTAFIITFIVVVLGVILVGKIVEKFINLIALGFLNKLGGLVFGIVKAAFFLSVIALIINSFDDDQSLITPTLREGSLLYKPIERFAPSIIPMLDVDDVRKIDIDTESLQKV